MTIRQPARCKIQRLATFPGVFQRWRCSHMFDWLDFRETMRSKSCTLYESYGWLSIENGRFFVDQHGLVSIFLKNQKTGSSDNFDPNISSCHHGGAEHAHHKRALHLSKDFPTIGVRCHVCHQSIAHRSKGRHKETRHGAQEDHGHEAGDKGQDHDRHCFLVEWTTWYQYHSEELLS